MAASSRILGIGLGDLAPTRNAELQAAGYELLPTSTMEEVARACWFETFDVAIVGHALSNVEKNIIVRCVREVFRLPVVLILQKWELRSSLAAESYVCADAPPEDLIHTIKTVVEINNLRTTGD
jgi:hypothetical protein